MVRGSVEVPEELGERGDEGNGLSPRLSEQRRTKRAGTSVLSASDRQREIKRLQELFEVKRDHLHRLRLKEARYGPLEVPVHIQIEIEELEKEIGRLRVQLEEVMAVPPAPDVAKVPLLRPGLQQMGAWFWVTVIALGLATIAGFAFVLLQANSSKATPTSVATTAIVAPVPTLTPTHFAPTYTSLPALPSPPTAWPTPTLQIPLPLPVVLQTQGCAKEQLRFKEDIRQAGGILVDQDSAVAQIEVACDGKQATIQVTLPITPAVTLDLYQEERLFTLDAPLAYSHAFLRGAVAYAGGDYLQADAQLADIRLDDMDHAWLLAQALVHLERLDEANDRYDTVIAQLPADVPPDRQARACAGRAYTAWTPILRLGDDNSPFVDACRQAMSDYTKALTLEPERGLWYAMRGLVRMFCWTEPEGARDDATQAQKLSDAPGESWLLWALIYSYLDDDPVQAAYAASQANEVSPGFALAYLVLGEVNAFRGECSQAEKAYAHYALLARTKLERQNVLWLHEHPCR